MESSLSDELRNPRRVLLTIPLLNKKLSTNSLDLTSPNIELQLTGSNNCNLNCWYCSTRRWGLGKNQTAPFFDPGYFSKLKIFQPKTIVLSGGEPTLYRPYNNFGFNEAISTIVRLFPSIKIGLITNGTVFPAGDWVNSCQWLRISLDAGCRQTYKTLKGVDLFKQVMMNFERYLNTNIPYVGLGYIYQKGNFDEIVDFTYDIFQKYSHSHKNKLSIQFRPIIYYPDSLPSTSQISKLKFTLQQIKNSSFIDFCTKNTNLYSICDLKKKDISSAFKHCYVCRVHKALNSNGDIFPCCLTFKNKKLCLGNIGLNTKKQIFQKEIAFFRESPCKSTCRLYRKNHLLEEYLDKDISKLKNQFICPNFF